MSEMTIRITDRPLDSTPPIALVPLWGEYRGVEASVRLRFEETRLYLQFTAREPQLLRMSGAHNQPVCEDSCVGVFLQAQGSDEYVNIECSASKKMLIGRGKGREGRTLYPTEYIDTIPCSVTILENSNARSRWKADLVLDLVDLGLVSATTPVQQVEMRGNFYKCGEKLKEPHYLAVAPIGTLKPDFHQPEYFANLIFEQ